MPGSPNTGVVRATSGQDMLGYKTIRVHWGQVVWREGTSRTSVLLSGAGWLWREMHGQAVPADDTPGLEQITAVWRGLETPACLVLQPCITYIGI